MFVVHCVIFSKNQMSVFSATEFCKGIYKILTRWLSVVVLPIPDCLDS